MENNTELICCAGCDTPLDVDGELLKCKACGATNLLGERAARALRHLKEINTEFFCAPNGQQAYGSASMNSSAVFYINSYATNDRHY